MKVSAALVFATILLLSNITGSAQSCTLTCPANMVIKADSSKEGASVVFPAATTVGDCGMLSYSPASGSFFRIGSHSVIVTTTYGQKCSFTVTVTDNESPVLSLVTLSSKELGSAINKMKDVAVYYTASDNAQDVTSVLSVSSNEAASNNRDWEIINNHLIRLKTSCLADGTPRVYTITVLCSDASGNTTKRTTHIAVSKAITPAYAAKD